MASQIHVFNRNGTYYFRRRVPKDLLSLYPSSQIIFSLKTKDRKEADQLARIESTRARSRVSTAEEPFGCPFNRRIVG